MVLVKVKDLKPTFGGDSFSWGDDKSKKLYKEIYNNGFDYEKSVITVTNDNHIIDGHHRVKILEDIYGGDYEIYVQKWRVSRKTYITLLVTISLILSPFNKTCRKILKFFYEKYM